MRAAYGSQSSTPLPMDTGGIMKRLISLGLYGAGLVTIDQPRTVKKYNQALTEIGIKKTKLTEFHIDGIGWSPEIAKEKSDAGYLNDTPANQFGIIVSPNQLRKPIFAPTMSYQRKLMLEYSNLYAQHVADITTDAAVTISFEDGVSRYETIDDLLDISSVSVESHAGDLTRIVTKQRALENELLTKPDAWQNKDLRTAILAEVKEHGDKRKRNALIENLVMETRSFATSALGGVYIFRTDDYEVERVVVESESQLNAVEKSKAPYRERVSHIDATDLLGLMRQSDLCSIDTTWFLKEQQVLTERLETLMMWIISHQECDEPLVNLNQARRRRLLSKATDEDMSLYFEFERCVAQAKQGKMSQDFHSSKVAELLAHPVDGLSAHTTQILWQLLCRRQHVPIDPLRFYATDKVGFFERYKTWPERFKEWVAPMIKERYRPIAA